MNRPYRDVPAAVWIGLVLVPVLILLVTALFTPELHQNLTYKEGPVEWLSVLVALTGAGVAVVAHTRRKALPVKWMRVLPALFFVGFIFVAGEESSWGQHIINPRLPGQPEEVKNKGLANIDPRNPDAVQGEEREKVLEQLNWLQRMNDQSETNLHNLPGWKGDVFAKWPKQLIEYGSIFACVIVPVFLVRKWNLKDPARLGYWFWPTQVCMVAAIVAFLLPWPKRLYEMFIDDKAPNVLRLSEPQELYLGIMLLMYILSLAIRLKQHQRVLDQQAAEVKAEASQG